MPKQMPFEKRCKEALKSVESFAKTANNWGEIHNMFLGIGGKMFEFFPEASERTKFSGTEEYKQIKQIMSDAPEGVPDMPRDQVSGKFVVRLPVSLHAALVREAKEEGVSLNQLCEVKLAVQLRAVV
ncbi:HicB family protein [Polystyrenella longa]|uniref:HicB family protein n=1 Tax=Polystyrenella longa TaxID=2528007 RepID=A0A518CU04_9PLAN|nr:toxin-antitoxin system HicB family antitoxin [Polystyrenella longa]QDU82691.1 HicB family protein [Polystyrenella longa]